MSVDIAIRKRSPRIVVLLSLCALFFPGALAAFEPPNPTVQEALKHGKVAFIGRIIKIEEVGRQPHQTDAKARVELLHCYYGIDCGRNKAIDIYYVSETVADRSLPVEFAISTEVLVILNRPISLEGMLFDSDWDDRIDIAYVVGDTFPKGYYDRGKLRLINIYLPRVVHRIDSADLAKWASERALQIKGQVK